MIFNCTGLGSRELFKDEELVPVRGQLEVLLPQPEIDYCLFEQRLHVSTHATASSSAARGITTTGR